MTPGRHTRGLFVAAMIVLLLVLVAAGWLILALVTRGGPGERPADIPPTRVVATTTPVNTLVPLVPATPTVLRPDPVLITPQIVPAVTRVPTVAPTPIPPRPDRPPIQRGDHEVPIPAAG